MAISLASFGDGQQQRVVKVKATARSKRFVGEPRGNWKTSESLKLGRNPKGLTWFGYRYTSDIHFFTAIVRCTSTYEQQQQQQWWQAKQRKNEINESETAANHLAMIECFAAAIRASKKAVVFSSCTLGLSYSF